MIERAVQVVNPLGLHARPAAQVVRLATTFAAELTLQREGEVVNAKSILGVMTLAAECGCTLVVQGEGADAEQAVTALADLITNGFGER